MDGTAEQECLVLEVQERHELGVADQIAEERGGGGVGGDAGGQDEAAAAPRADDRAGGLGEDGVGVDVAAAGERVPAGFAEQVAPACGLAQFGLELVVQRPVGRAVAVGEGGDQLLACRRVRGVRDLGLAGGEELLLLELDPLPGRVADDAGEAAGPAGGRVDVRGAVADAEDVRELDVPVEEAVLAGEVCDQFLGCGQFQGPGVRAELLQDRLGDRGGAGDGGLGLDECRAPGVGEELLDAEFG